jgi:phosphinothricin acetyltransferase
MVRHRNLRLPSLAQDGSVEGMSEIVVRAAVGRDLQELTDIYNHYVRTSPATFDLEPASLHARREWVSRYADSGPHRLLVATAGDAIAGYATSGKFRERPGYRTSVETTVYVHPERQARGVGARLYAALFAALASEDVHRAYAAVVLPNPASVALHERFGFAPVGLFREAGRKFGRYWDVQWFERALP